MLKKPLCPWYILVYSGILWYILVSYGILWYVDLRQEAPAALARANGLRALYARRPG